MTATSAEYVSGYIDVVITEKSALLSREDDLL